MMKTITSMSRECTHWKTKDGSGWKEFKIVCHPEHVEVSNRIIPLIRCSDFYDRL